MAKSSKNIEVIEIDSQDDYQEVYEVEQILGIKEEDGETEYRVKWKGYGNESNTWEPACNLTAAWKLIEDFKNKPTMKPKPQVQEKIEDEGKVIDIQPQQIDLKQIEQKEVKQSEQKELEKQMDQTVQTNKATKEDTDNDLYQKPEKEVPNQNPQTSTSKAKTGITQKKMKKIQEVEQKKQEKIQKELDNQLKIKEEINKDKEILEIQVDKEKEIVKDQQPYSKINYDQKLTYQELFAQFEQSEKQIEKNSQMDTESKPPQPKNVQKNTDEPSDLKNDKIIQILEKRTNEDGQDEYFIDYKGYCKQWVTKSYMNDIGQNDQILEFEFNALQKQIKQQEQQKNKLSEKKKQNQILYEEGSFHKNDIIKDIQLKYQDSEEAQANRPEQFVFKVNWQKRENGFQPFPSFETYSNIKKYQPYNILKLWEYIYIKNNRSTRIKQTFY